MATGWLDSVLAMPSIGVTASAMLRLPSAVWPAVDRLYQVRLIDNPNQKFEIASGEVGGGFGLQINLENGLFIKIDMMNVVAGYTLQVNALTVPGNIPKLEDFSPAAFSQLQSNAFKALTRFLHFFDFDLQVIRIGVVAESRIVESQAPPGVAKYMSDLGAAARGKLIAVSGALLTELNRVGFQREQCHHICTKNDDGTPDDLTLKLDWQRVWSEMPVRILKKDELAKQINSAIESGNAYFEKFGSGEED